MIKLSVHIVLIIFLSSPLLMVADTLNVCSDCTYKNIKDVLSSAQDGDIVVVKGGHFHEGNIIINKRIQMIGVDKPVIDGENRSEILTVEHDSVSIEGFCIQNVGVSFIEDCAGIRIVNAENCTIKNNELINTFFGIYLEHVKNTLIINNKIIGEANNEATSGNAIHMWHCNNMIIENNIVKNHRDGIYIEFVKNSVVRNNVSEDNLRYGLHFMFSDDNSYNHNIFRKNGAGVAVMFSRRIVMKNNLFINNWGTASYGLLLKEIYDSHILGNEFIMNTVGIYAEGATRVTISDNTLSENGWAMKFMGSSINNIITNNDFIANTFDLAANKSSSTNNFSGNYWSKYSGYDLDHDGIGDIPYRPVQLFSYIVSKTPETIVLLKSLFITMIDFSERVNPIFTPENIVDNSPKIKQLNDHN